MTENKFDMAVITAVDGEGCLACSWDKRDLESEEIDLEDGEKIPAMSYEKEVVFNLITAVLSDMVKRDEGLFLSVVENLKEKKNSKKDLNGSFFVQLFIDFLNLL